MSNSVAQQISLLRSQILARRFDAATLRIIESVMASKDVMEVRSSLREFFRSESMSIIRENADKPLDKKLLDLEFLVRSFALLGDVESCLALRYEALLLRDFKSSSHQWLKVSYTEWLNFAEQSLDYGFHSVARKACENALSCFQKNSGTDAKTVESSESSEVIEKIKRLQDYATTSAASHSVQALAAEYTKSKLMLPMQYFAGRDRQYRRVRDQSQQPAANGTFDTCSTVRTVKGTTDIHGVETL
ncbi:hypothetical protein TIFTF001_000186 [Ficus carica]|uniref:Uncharacterized protein n=1 Tax=Ficus carica TaxID=3494 RepID=A0AA88CJG7_FICCA|nr:hypothetical protein TIFTF001_000186 [Ficus carica]